MLGLLLVCSILHMVCSYHNIHTISRISGCKSVQSKTKYPQVVTFLATDDIAVRFYDFQLQLSNSFSSQLSQSTPLTSVLLVMAGFLTAVSPCSLGLLPLTVAYLDNKSDNSDRKNILSRATSYSLGVLFAFVVLASIAIFFSNNVSSVAALFPDAAEFKDVIISILYIILGLNLLEILQIPILQTNQIERFLPDDKNSNNLQSFLFGAVSALIGSSCTTPVLTALLAFISNTNDIYLSLFTLLLFSVGYVSPVLIAASLKKSTLTNLRRKAGNTEWINQLFASILLVYGSYQLTSLVINN